MADEFKIVKNIDQGRYFGTDCLYFKNKNKIVDDSGKLPSANYLGHCYRLVSRFEEDFSFFERSGKALLGIIIVICTLSLALFSKSIRKLFTKKHYSINYGVEIPPTSLSFPINNTPVKKSPPNPTLTDSSTKDKIKADFSDILPDELNLEIFSYLDSDDLVSCLEVNRKWRNLASCKELLKKSSGTLYDKEAWACLGDIGNEPEIPLYMHKILRTGWIAAIIPSTINGFPYTLNGLSVLAGSPKTGNSTKFNWVGTTDQTIKNIWNRSVPKSYWILMPKQPLKTRSSLWRAPLIAEKLAEKTNMAFKIPSTLEAATVLSLHHIIKGESLFPLFVFPCEETVKNKWGYQKSIYTGRYSQDGLTLSEGCNDEKICRDATGKWIDVERFVAVRKL